MTKDDFRKLSLDKRNALDREARNDKDLHILHALHALAIYKASKYLFTYVSYGNEVSTRGLITTALADGKKVFCPAVTDGHLRSMEFLEVRRPEDLEKGYKGIEEPGENSTAFKIDQLSEEYKGIRYRDLYNAARDGEILVIMPGTAFNEGMERLGYNGGFYDRYLERLMRAGFEFRTLALCYECQMFTEKFPLEKTDILMDEILTEDRLLKGKG